MNSPPQTSSSKLPKEFREVSVVHMTDPTAVRGSIEVLNQDVVNLDPKSFEVKRVTVPLEECCLIYTHTNAAVRSRTLVHKDFDACSILGPQARGSFDGAALLPYSMMTGGPGAQVEIIVESNYESVALLVPPRILDKHLTLRRIKADFVVPENHDLLHPETEVARDLFELGARIAAAAEKTPEIFNDSHWARYGAQVEFMDSLVCDNRIV